jgi:hypothetical protein
MIVVLKPTKEPKPVIRQAVPKRAPGPKSREEEILKSLLRRQ